MGVVDVWTVVFITRTEFEHVSEIAELQKPAGERARARGGGVGSPRHDMRAAEGGGRHRAQWRWCGHRRG
eukprot:2205938-Prymnesium_polylepis.2